MNQANDNAQVPWTIKLDTAGNVLLSHDDPAALLVLNLGPKDAACEALRAFLVSIDGAGCG